MSKRLEPIRPHVLPGLIWVQTVCKWQWQISSIVQVYPGISYLPYIRGRSRISGKGVHEYKGVGVRFADFISFFLNMPWKRDNLVSGRPNYFIFIGYLKTRGREGGSSEPPLDPPLLYMHKHKLHIHKTTCSWRSSQNRGDTFNTAPQAVQCNSPTFQ